MSEKKDFSRPMLMVSQLNDINTKLRSKISSDQTTCTELKTKYSAKITSEQMFYTELKAEIKLLKSLIKTLKREVTLVQKASFHDKFMILTLKAKVIELEGKLEDLKLD